MAQIAGCGPDQYSDQDLKFLNGKGISNRDGTATIVAASGGFTWTGDLDLNDNLDLDVALTGTGDAANISATMSHATQTAEALDVSIAQITSARTSGDLIAIKASITSLTGSTAGVDHVAYDAACTAGDADSDHILLRQGANFSRTIDTSAAATGEAAWLLKANVADALSILDSTGDMVVYTTTTATPGIAETMARTGAGAGHSVAVTANSASATMQGLSVSASQITTARTSGTLTGVKSAVTSLSGDTSGVDYYAFEAAVTAGEANADHFALKVGAGFDAAIDSSSASTGETDWLVAANVADALTVRGASLNYLTLKTTTATPNWLSSLALTGAGNAWDIDATIAHASGALIGLDVTAAQVTTARTSGTVTGVKSSITSLTGDTSGVDYYAFEAAVTVGEANADHFALKVGAGFDAIMDLTAAATGESDIVVKDNIASALQVREGSNVYIDVRTTDAAEGVDITGLITKSSTASAITGVTTLTSRDSGGVFSVAKTGAYAITLPTPAQGLRFKFMVLDTGANIVTISNGSAHLFGMVSVNNVSTQANGSTTCSLASGGSIGDWVEFVGIDATHYLVTGACKDASDIAFS